MNKRFYSFILGFTAVFTLLVGCEKEADFIKLSQEKPNSVKVALAGEGVRGSGTNALGSGEEGVLDEYIASLRAFAYYSGALTLKPAEGDRIGNAPSAINPITYQLQYDYAIDPGGERQYDFFELELEERADFYEQILRDEREFLAERLELEPKASLVLAARSRTMQSVLRDCVGFDVLQVLSESVETQQSNDDKRKVGLPQILKAINEISEQTMRQQSNRMLRELERRADREHGDMGGGSSSGESSGPKKKDMPRDPVFAEKMRNIYQANGVQRGQILYRGMWENSITGHAAIIIDPNIPLNGKASEHLLSIDAYPDDGVQNRTVQSWNYKHYVLGVRKIWYTWEKAWWIVKKLVRHESRLYDMRGAAEVAETKRGKPYAEKISRAKHFENEFICSSLVWYSVKHGCTIEGEAVDLVAWRPNTIWPTDLWLDKKTFVVAKVDK